MKNKLIFAAAVTAFVLFMGMSYFSYDKLSRKEENGFGAKEIQTAESKIAAADFTVLDSNGKEVKLSDMRGKPTVVNFWATWCPPCRSEMPHFQKAYESLGEKVNFMMIDLLAGGETRQKARQYAGGEGFSFPIYYDATGEASGKYNVSAIPTSIFIDANGSVTETVIGAMNASTLMRNIDKAGK
ncbi:MAG: TlpA family protein disulfide reductase [Synergistaceae bacterium]|jgi:thiol-disulfide isomerase/thioredoxin|nr:TlpA family protein disulfide reductase [Synergistaceae bacterium]